eukprot:GHVU01233368.1.p5 GENE.GHVU01233368.1~~GHVU01233368.1.p5  ORF type:complete len:114 (-),score=13.89 GHVU01233368.1:571-912(-)
MFMCACVHVYVCMCVCVCVCVCVQVLEVFGCGTAAAVCPAEGIAYDGKEYDIPLDPLDPTAGTYALPVCLPRIMHPTGRYAVAAPAAETGRDVRRTLTGNWPIHHSSLLTTIC